MWRLIVRYCVGVSLVASSVGANALAQSKYANPPSPTPPLGELGEPSDRPSSTAEEILSTLRRIRPQGELIQSARMMQQGKVETQKKLYPEGAHLVSQVGRVRQELDWWYFEFEENGELINLKMLPNATLEAVVRSAHGQEQSIRFVISGEYSVYKGENFIFPRIAMRSVAKSISEPYPAVTSTPTISDTETTTSADDVLAKIREQQPSEQILPRTDMLANRYTNKPLQTAYLQDGAPLIRRPGRVVPRGDWLTFVFESDTPDYPELPLKLLPNQVVELMQHATQRDTEGVVFIVSGEITAFMGENYLLPRVALRRVDTGNLTK